MKRRTTIPRNLRRQLLIEAGYHCSIPHCTVDSSLEFHHIDGNPSNNTFDNILVVCSNHHTVCTRGKIDKKACRTIKKTLVTKELRISVNQSDLKKFRRVLREELTHQSQKQAKKRSTKSMFLSRLDRNYLFRCLSQHRVSKYDSYAAICVLGEMKYRGSTTKIIDFVERLRKSSRSRERIDFQRFYRVAIESLSKISTREALNWLAGEYMRKRQNVLNQFLLFLAIAGARKPKEYLGFEIANRKVSKMEKGRTLTETTFVMKKKNYKFVLETIV